MTDLIWQPWGIETPQAEWMFHPTRRWRFDYAWIYKSGKNVAVEIEGGIWTAGRHTRGRGYLGDLEKYNEATRLHWRVFRFTPQQLKKGEAQNYMRKVFDALEPK